MGNGGLYRPLFWSILENSRSCKSPRIITDFIITQILSKNFIINVSVNSTIYNYANYQQIITKIAFFGYFIHASHSWHD